MAGHVGPLPTGPATAAQEAAIARAEGCASLVEPQCESRDAAPSALLEATAEYDPAEGIGDVACVKAGAISLPRCWGPSVNVGHCAWERLH